MNASPIERLAELAQSHEELLWILGAGSVAMLIATAIAVPFVVVRLPEDFYRRAEVRLGAPRRSGALWLLWKVVRNVLGTALLVAGFVMLVLPGQGILTILVALAVLDFRGKRKAELWLLRRPSVRRSVDWLRRRAGRPPLDL